MAIIDELRILSEETKQRLESEFPQQVEIEFQKLLQKAKDRAKTTELRYLSCNRIRDVYFDSLVKRFTAEGFKVKTYCICERLLDTTKFLIEW